MTGTGPTPEREVAFRVLRRVSEGAYADRALAGEAERAGLSGPLRAQAHRIVFGAVQRRRTLDWVIDRCITNGAGLEPEIRDVLRLGAYELGYSDGVPASAAVDQSVRLARSLPGAERRRGARAGLVNAVLRRVAREIDPALAGLGDATVEEAALRHSVPDWLARELFSALGPDAARVVLAAANEPTESIVRWNPLRGSREAFEALLPDGASRDDELPFAYRIPGAFSLEASPIWRDGLGVAQSRASMLPVVALDPRPGERILDLCAAPGAKTTMIAATTGNDGELVAVESRPARAAGLRSLADRLGATVRVIEGDARSAPIDGVFDAVLVDPPCTGLGVLAARPDARWRREEDHVARLAELQAGLLARALECVAPGGRVVYSTCTLLPAENEHVVRATGRPLDDLTPLAPRFAHPELRGALRTLPGRDGTDGFFVARIRVESR